jgi:hypothetical protein
VAGAWLFKSINDLCVSITIPFGSEEEDFAPAPENNKYLMQGNLIPVLSNRYPWRQLLEGT